MIYHSVPVKAETDTDRTHPMSITCRFMVEKCSPEAVSINFSVPHTFSTNTLHNSSTLHTPLFTNLLTVFFQSDLRQTLTIDTVVSESFSVWLAFRQLILILVIQSSLFFWKHDSHESCLLTSASGHCLGHRQWSRSNTDHEGNPEEHQADYHERSCHSHRYRPGSRYSLPAPRDHFEFSW